MQNLCDPPRFCVLCVKKFAQDAKISAARNTKNTKNNVFVIASVHTNTIQKFISDNGVDSQILYFVCFVPSVVPLLVFP